MTIEIVTDPLVPSHYLAEWALERLPGEDLEGLNDLGSYIAFGVVKRHEDGRYEPLCVVIYNWFRQMEHGNDLRVIIASDNPRWCLPGVLRALFAYPFEVVGCARLTAVIRDGNARSLKLCQGLGFKREGTIRRGHNGKTNAILLGMLKEECKWLYGDKKKPQPTKQEHIDGQKVAFRSEGTGPGTNNRRRKRSKPRRSDRERAIERGERAQSVG